jgi:hypothetical protein
MKNNIVFEPSNVHQGHYVILNGEDTGIVVNLYCYKINEDYKKEIDNKIQQYATNNPTNRQGFSKS